MTFGEKLQRLRKEEGLSQEQLAVKLTVSRQAISKWELDASLPDMENVLQLSDIFDVSTDYLLKEQNEQITLSKPTQKPTVKIKGRLSTKIMMLVGGIGILIFWILSFVFPAFASYISLNAEGEEVRMISKTGLLPFLKMHNIEIPFILCCAVFLVGLIIYIISLIRARQKNKNNM